MRRVRTLVVDCDLQFLSEAVGFLRELKNIDLVGAAVWGLVAVRYATRLNPDLVLLGLALPDMSALQAARLILQRPLAPVVVALSSRDDDSSRAAALNAGARAFVTRSDLVTRLPDLLSSLFPGAHGEGLGRSVDG